MKLVMALLLVAACGGPKTKTESPLVNEGSGAKPENCCCKSNPLTSEDGRPVYEAGTNRMECSTKQGTCVDDVQCTQQAPTKPMDKGEGG